MTQTQDEAKEAAEFHRRIQDHYSKLVCYLCAEGNQPIFDQYTGRYYHIDQFGNIYNSGWCRADAIRQESHD